MEIRSRLLRLVALMCLVVGAQGCSDGGGTTGPPAEARATIGPNGGTIVVSSGPLAGASIEIPAGALSRPTTISVLADPAFGVRGTLPTATNIEGTEVFGNPIRFEPAGLVLNQRATIRMPGGLSPDPTGGGDPTARRTKIVLNRPSTARIEDAFLTTSLEWQIDELGTVWILSYGAELEFPIEQFMFQSVGDFFAFEGFLLVCDDLRSRAILGGLDVFELSRFPPFPDPANPLTPGVPLRTEDALFLERTLGGELLAHGFATYFLNGLPVRPDQVFQAPTPLTLLPREIRADQAFGPFAVVNESPYRVEIELGAREPFETPFGVFPDTMRLRLRFTSPAVQEFDFVLAFQQGVVGYGLVGGTGATSGISGRVLSGTLGGQPMPPR